MTPEIIGMLFATVTAVLFAVGTVIARLGLMKTPVVTGTALSMTAGTVVLVLLASPRYSAVLPSLTIEAWAWLAVTAVINYPIGRLMLFNAIKNIGVARGNTIVAANPVVAGFAAVLWFNETLNPLIAAGLGASVLGAMIVLRSTPDPNKDESGFMTRNVIVRGYSSAVAAMIAYGTVSVLVKKLVLDVAEPRVAASMVFLIGTLVLSAIAIPRVSREIRLINSRSALLLISGGALMSLGVFSFYAAAERAPIVAVAPIVSISPLVAIFAAQITAGKSEQITRPIWAGAMMVVAGVILIGLSL